jgi:hypothetical protein
MDSQIALENKEAWKFFMTPGPEVPKKSAIHTFCYSFTAVTQPYSQLSVDFLNIHRQYSCGWKVAHGLNWYH